MIKGGMLKWAVVGNDPPKSLRKRKQGDMQRDAAGLISGCCKHRNGPSRILHKNCVRAVGVINNNNLLNNESDNGKVNVHNYKVSDQNNPSLKVSPTTVNTTTTTTTLAAASPLHHNNNNIINSDSKSLLYMSLDHLPMAIVKQYERMLQDSPLKQPPKSALKSQHDDTNCSNNNSTNHQNRPPNVKIKNQKQVSTPHKKPHSKSITFKEDVNEGKTNNKHKTECQKKPYSVPALNLKASEISIKEAQHRPLKVLSGSVPSHKLPILQTEKFVSYEFNKKHPYDGKSSPTPDCSTTKRKIDIPEKHEKSPKLPTKKSALVCDKSRPPRSTTNASVKNESASPVPLNHKPDSNITRSETIKTNLTEENDENDPNCVPKLPVKTLRGQNFTLVNSADNTAEVTNSTTAVISATGARMPNPHDTTDPQFLEPKCITYSTPPVAKCAKKLTLKKSELKKLERLKTKTERLNRFLKKYYHDCLPNLPEDEEDSCSPEEKSVRLSVWKEHWREVKANEHYFLAENGEVDPDIFHSCYENIAKHYQGNTRFPFSNPKVFNKFSPLHTSSYSSYTTLPELSVDDYSVTWENLLNSASPALISSYSNESPHPGLLPIIQEDSAEVSSSSNSEYHIVEQEKEIVRDIAAPKLLIGMDESFLMSKTRIETDDSFVHLTKESLGLSDEHHQAHHHHDGMSNNFNTSVKISSDEGDGGEEEGGFGTKKLKALLLQPLGELFDPPASLAEDEGFMGSPSYPPEAYSPASSSSTSTFNRFSVSSSSGKGSTRGDVEEHESEEHCFQDDYDKEQSNHGRTSSQSPSSSSDTDAEIASMEEDPKYVMEELKHENANYLRPTQRSVLVVESCNHNETWNSHGYVPNSPCGTISSSHSHYSTAATASTSSSPIPGQEEDGDETFNFNLMRNQRENDHGEESVVYSNKLALGFSTPVLRSKSLPQTRLKFKSKKYTPRKVVRKPPVSSAYSGKGELLIRTYKNDGHYVTVHVVQARRLESYSHSSWKLSIKVSCLPEAETTFTRSSETILVGRNRSWAKIDQKFSFEVPSSLDIDNTKVFLTAVKRLGKKSSFLGWTTLTLFNEETTQSWLKLRKRKMSTTTPVYPMKSCHSTFTPNPSSKSSSREPENRSNTSMDSPSPQPGHTDNGSSSSSRCDCEMDDRGPIPKSGLQNSSTMDSGVEDCCEPPPPPAPSIDLDDKNGQRVGVRMIKPDGGGYGFSVVWVNPPRIERLEKGKTADAAGLRIGDLIIGVNGEDVTSVPNTTIYTKIKATEDVLQLEVWRTTPPIQSRNTQPNRTGSTIPGPTPLTTSSIAAAITSSTTRLIPNINESRGVVYREVAQQQPQLSTAPVPVSQSTVPKRNTNSNINQTQVSTASVPSRIQKQSPPTSILKPPPPVQHTTMVKSSETTSNQSQPGSSSWRIRFNIELLDNEDDCLKQFFICELKFFRKIVAALDRYLIPAQSNKLLTPQEINLIFSNVIKIITITKRILNCVANGSSNAGWKFEGVLLSTHTDHLSELASAYSTYAKTLGYSSMILSDKMSIQEFARFVLEIQVPKGHLDMTSLIFAPLEHLRNICEICEEISHSSESWSELFTNLKELYADIVCDTDFMEPISHVSMKKNPLLSVRDLEKRVVSTSCQPVKVCEKGRRWLFGSRLFKKESDGSWSPVWAFLFSDIIVLTSHTTRDRVFFVKEAPIRLEDVVTLHFNLPKKHENEFRLLFEPEPVHQSRLDKLLPLHRNKKANQIALRAPNIQLKSIWKLLLQRQIITLNTRLSKSSSSNFSISEFCERFPITPQCEDEKDDHPPPTRGSGSGNKKGAAPPIPTRSTGSQLAKSSVTPAPTSIFDRQNVSDERNLSVIKEEKSCSQLKPQIKPYAPDGLSSMSKELLKSRVPRILPERKGRAVESIPEEKVSAKPHDPTDTIARHSENQTPRSSANTNCLKPFRIDAAAASISTYSSQSHGSPGGLRSTEPQIPSTSSKQEQLHNQYPSTSSTSTSTDTLKPVPSPTNNNNNEIIDFNQTARVSEKCPCVETVGKVDLDISKRNASPCSKIKGQNQAPAVKPRTQTRKSFERNDSEEHTVGPPLKVESPRPAPRPDLQQRNNNMLTSSPSPVPSPSMSNNRVEALKYEGAGSSGLIKSKPGSKILTNATLKSRQQELLAKKESQPIITMVENPSSNSANGTDYILISQPIEPRIVVTATIKDTKDASSSPLLAPRCQSENGFVKPKQVHTDSPILTGFGSEKSRRRVLYDYKVQRDYPELFGISPNDRRTFIKQLAERKQENEKPLVAPYYFSPLPTPKFMKRSEVPEPSSSTTSSLQNIKPISISQGASYKNPPQSNDIKIATVPNPHGSKLFNELKQRLIQQNLVDSDTDAGERCEENEMSLKDMARGILRNAHSDEENSDEDSHESDEGELGAEVRAQVHRQRSPEESSNDSGISDEVTEKSKSNGGKENERFQSNMAVNSSEVTISSKISNTIVTHCKMQLLPKTAPHACILSSTKSIQLNTKIDPCFEGEEETGMATVVVLKATSDKCTGTDDEYFSHTMSTTTTTTSYNNHPEKSMRTLMAERREAFFASYNQTSFSSHRTNSFHSPQHSSHSRMIENGSPLKVKIVDGGTLQSTHHECIPALKSPPEERVQLTRFPEKERNARVERVESSDDSTSSDLASASPAAENGTIDMTTDPSWSSSSSSLAGGTSNSRHEEPSTSMSTSVAISIYNSCPLNNSQNHVASTSSLTKVFMSDFTNGLPSTSFCNGSLSLCGNSHCGGPEIVVTQESPETPTVHNGCSSEGEDEDSVLLVCNGSKSSKHSGSESGNKKTFLRVESNDSTAENFGDDDDYNFDEDELSQCSVATINRYGTYESLEKIEENEDGLPDFSNKMTRSKARFTFEDDDSDDDNDLFEEDFESDCLGTGGLDFNFRFPGSQIQDNTYSVSRLGPLPPLLEEDFEDDMYDEQRAGSSSASPGPLGISSTSLVNGATLRARHEISSI